eukprot:gene1792-33212_t
MRGGLCGKVFREDGVGRLAKVESGDERWHCGQGASEEDVGVGQGLAKGGSGDERWHVGKGYSEDGSWPRLSRGEKWDESVGMWAKVVEMTELGKVGYGGSGDERVAH